MVFLRDATLGGGECTYNPNFKVVTLHHVNVSAYLVIGYMTQYNYLEQLSRQI